ncbi:MAG: hypothetical protein METHAR1v1_1850007 [Methanothrix sp.]|nr:MAG: hypothetical protein METHAR1v1_1850007 [Methanothrix sp.]
MVLLCTMAAAEASGDRDWGHSKKSSHWKDPSSDWLSPWNFDSYYSRYYYPYSYYYPSSYYYTYYYPSSYYYNWYYYYPYYHQYPFYSYPLGSFSQIRYSLVVG